MGHTMTIYTVERALFEVISSPERLAQYKAEPEVVLRSYPLSADEVDLILKMNVSEIVRRGLNPMLAMRAFGAIEGRNNISEYFRRIRET